MFVIGDTTEHVEKTCAFLSEHFGKCEILGAEAFENCQGGTDAMVNEINALTPDMILSVLPSPDQEHFLMESVPGILQSADRDCSEIYGI